MGGGGRVDTVKSSHPAESLSGGAASCPLGGWTGRQGNENIQMPGHSPQHLTVQSLNQENWIQN